MTIIDQKPLHNTARIAIVISKFNDNITHKLYEGAIERLQELDHEDPFIVWVPGAIEIPLMVQKLASFEQYEAIIALGAVIRGETSHYDYVCDQVSRGCQKIMLDYDVPVIFGVLTTENETQAHDRLGGAHGHKGREAVDAAFHMISLNRQLS